MKKSGSDWRSCWVREDRAMRVLKVSHPGPVTLTPAAEIGRVLLEKCHALSWPHPQITIELFSVMNWPNNEIRRDLYTAAFSLAYASPGLLSPLNLTGINEQRIDFRALGEGTLDL